MKENEVNVNPVLVLEASEVHVRTSTSMRRSARLIERR
jgi:hypothetical protein